MSTEHMESERPGEVAVQILSGDSMSAKPYVIVVGNEKGGSGKSTVAMHMIVSLLSEGHSVGSIDIDRRIQVGDIVLHVIEGTRTDLA